jgi:RNAse (barnase) inhibitor barstar
VSSAAFVYFDKFKFELDPTRFTFFVPTQIQTEDDLFNAFYEGMNFPGYFGFNYNALIDCLSSLDWCEAAHVRIVHFNVPALGAALGTYVSSLQDVVNRVNERSEYDFSVWFPATEKLTLEQLRHT